ncbi:MAG: trypsin-like peptidase domain-containing protein [Thermoplasmatales archaeon]|nr:trypsin-like peptidase domain-containing protein [Thermoplasmatales archaeon]
MISGGNFQEEITDAVSKIRDGVVMIRNKKFQADRYGEVFPVMGAGSGIVLSSSGYIVTNNHVVQESQELEVTTRDGDTFEAEIVGNDPATDVALIKINAKGLVPCELGNSEDLKVGQFVLAVGNALGLPGDPSVSLGVISALERPMPWADFIFEGLIQTDAAINPGNSGGPLSTLDGKIIGMNTAIIAFARGVGFAIPSMTIKRVMEQILEYGRVVRPWLGISGSTITSDMQTRFWTRGVKGVVVARISRESPAFEAGLRPWDIITGINGESVTDMKSLLERLSRIGIGDIIALDFLREGRKLGTKITIQEMPDHYLNERWMPHP